MRFIKSGLLYAVLANTLVSTIAKEKPNLTESQKNEYSDGLLTLYDECYHTDSCWQNISDEGETFQIEANAPLHWTAYTGPPLITGPTIISLGLSAYNTWATSMKNSGADCNPKYLSNQSGFILYYKPTGSCDTTASVQQMRDSLAAAVKSLDNITPGHAGCIRLDHGGNYQGYVALGTANMNGADAVGTQCLSGEQVSDGDAKFVRTEL